MLIAQITDCHVIERDRLLHGRVDTAERLLAAVEQINSMTPKPDVVLATGDLVNDGTHDQYANLSTILDEIEAPVLAIPGNHDDRDALRSALGQEPGLSPDEPMNVVNDEWPLRLVGLDTTVPGQHGGRVTNDQMAWLDVVLSSEPERPTLIFQHHPPFVTGIDWMDAVGLEGSELEAATISAHPQVQAVVCGHVHRLVQTKFAGTVASTWPSTGAQVALALDGTPHTYVDETPAVAIHRWSPDGGLVSHVSYVNDAETWKPDWA
ncbi:MAG: phosphodiesterase [Acidimicrobiales bacterium]